MNALLVNNLMKGKRQTKLPLFNSEFRFWLVSYIISFIATGFSLTYFFMNDITFFLVFSCIFTVFQIISVVFLVINSSWYLDRKIEKVIFLGEWVNEDNLCDDVPVPNNLCDKEVKNEY